MKMHGKSLHFIFHSTLFLRHCNIWEASEHPTLWKIWLKFFPVLAICLYVKNQCAPVIPTVCICDQRILQSNWLKALTQEQEFLRYGVCTMKWITMSILIQVCFQQKPMTNFLKYRKNLQLFLTIFCRFDQREFIWKIQLSTTVVEAQHLNIQDIRVHMILLQRQLIYYKKDFLSKEEKAIPIGRINKILRNYWHLRLIWEIIKFPTISKYSNEIWKPEIIFLWYTILVNFDPF